MTTPPREAMSPLEAFSLADWIDANRSHMVPPITNQTIFKGNDNFIVMAVGGPNQRKDYHYNESEELFLQLQGDVEIGLYVDGEMRTEPLRAGEMLLIPPRVPHQPRRLAGTTGLVIEKHRVPTDRDGFLYFCDHCDAKLFAQYFVLEDIIEQLPLVQRAFYDSLEHRTCDTCGKVTEQPEGWRESIRDVAASSRYADDPLARLRGRSW